MLTLTHRTHRVRSGVLRPGRAAHGGAAAVVLAVLVAGTVAWGAVGVLLALALAPAAAAALVDGRTGRLPDPLVAASVVPTLALAAGAALAGHGAVAPVAAGALAMALPLLVLHLAAPGSMGFGDVKLGVALGALVGVVDPRAALAVLAIASGSALVVAVARRRAAVAFGPSLVAATGAVLVLLATLGWEAPRWR